MTIDEIIEKHRVLNSELRLAVASMDRKNTITLIRERMKKLQEQCPHVSVEYDWEPVNGECPYCGKKVE